MVTYILGTAIVLLACLLSFLPLRLTWNGKAAVFFSGAGISLLPFMGSQVFSIWMIFAIQLVLVGLVSFLLVKNVSVFDTEDDDNEDRSQNTVPLFSYAELKEKAEQATTMDHYYMDSKKIDEDDEIEMIVTKQSESILIDEDDRKEFVVDTSVYVDDFIERPLDEPVSDLTFDHEQNVIDYEQRELAYSVDDPDEEMEETAFSVEEVDFIEIRKKLFEDLDDAPSADFILDSQNNETNETAEPPFSSKELDYAFDDLEELYLKNKASKPKEGESK